MPIRTKLASTTLAATALLASVLAAMSLGAGTGAAEKAPAPDPMAQSPALAQELAAAREAQRASARARVSAARGGGGISLTPNPTIRDAYCVKQCVAPRRPTPGAVVRIVGAYMDGVVRVVFPGKKKKRMRAKYRARSSTAVRVVVPRGADDGRPFVVTGDGAKSNRSPAKLKIVPKTAIPREVFPVRGPFSYGSDGSRFGSGRPGHIHQGQDLSASCGTKLVAVKKAKVVYNQWDDGGGNYIVLANKGDNTSFVYMHLIRPAKPKVGSIVAAGEPIGPVGTTGTSSGCHLHFEYWIGPWQTGGEPIDPLPYLKSLQE
jgi:murein DD-endopeptidase MepM/ murein hydrolase activator NlpD